MQELIGIPSWIAGVIAAAVIVVFQILNYAVQLRRKIVPRIEITFDEVGSIIDTPQQITGGVGTAMYKALYVRGKVATNSAIAVMDCNVFLTKVTKKLPTGEFGLTKFVDGIPLLWASSESQYSIKIPKGVPRYFDIVSINESSNLLELTSIKPFRLADLFNEPGTYRLKVVAIADGAGAEAIFEIVKGQQWNDLSGKQIEGLG